MATRKGKAAKRSPSKAPGKDKRAVKSRTAGARKPAKAKPRKVPAIPKGYHTATPYLIVKGAAAAIAFYVKAFGAKEKVRMTMPDGSVMHAEIMIGDSYLMLSEENPAWGTRSPLALGGNATHVMLYVKDCDAFMARAASAGASVLMPAANMFWGDRYGKLADPFGHQWSIGTHIEDVSPREMRKRADEAGKQMANQAA